MSCGSIIKTSSLREVIYVFLAKCSGPVLSWICVKMTLDMLFEKETVYLRAQKQHLKVATIWDVEAGNIYRKGGPL